MISCVIPTRDRAAMAAAAVASVRAQEGGGRELEIVVVDDGSVDGTMDRLAARFPGLRQVRLAGLGPGAARNAGVAAATGDIIMFLDSDDLWTPDHLRRLWPPLSAGHQVVYGVTRNHDQLGGEEFFIPESEQICRGSCFEALLRWCFLVPSAVAVTRRAFDRVGGFSRAGLGEDWGFFLQLAQFYDFAFAGPKVIANRRLHAGSLCRLHDPSVLDEALVGLRDLPWQPTHRPAAVGRFAALRRWLAARPVPPATVQEWYRELKRDNMV